MPARTFGVDWAVYQQTGDVAKLKREGGSFVIAKASQDWAEDSAFDTTFWRTKKNGLVAGAYHFLIEPGCGTDAGYNNKRGATSAEEQAVTFVRIVKDRNGGSPDGVLCALDLEDLDWSSLDGSYRNILSSPKAYHARAFAKRFHELAPRHPLFL